MIQLHPDDHPFIIETDVLPIEVYLSGEAEPGRIQTGRVYLEMRDAYGRLVIADAERMHLGDLYVAHCVFDRYGTWILTWQGLRPEAERRPEPMRIEVMEVPLYEDAEVC